MKSLCKLQILRDILLNIYYQYRFEGQKFTGSYRRVYLWLIASVIQLYLIIHLTPEVNIFLGLLNCPYLVSFAPSWAAHLIQSWSISAFLVFLLPFCDPLIPPLILFFSYPLLFNSSVPSYILSDSFSLLYFPLFFFFFFPVISRRLFWNSFCFCFLQVCPSITSCSSYMWGFRSQQEANVCTYHNYADFLHFVIDLLLLRSLFILAEQILSRLT